METITLSTKTHKLPCAPERRKKGSKLPTGKELRGMSCETKPEAWGKTVIDVDYYTYPEIAPGRVFKNPVKPIVHIHGRNWIVDWDLHYSNEGVPKGGTLTFTPTTEPETPFEDEKPDYRRTKFFGQPKFRQGEVFPHKNGKAACLLATIESRWGDSGNENIFITLDEKGNPDGVYHEYSSCGNMESPTDPDYLGKIRIIALAGYMGKTRFDRETPYHTHVETIEERLHKKGAPLMRRMLALTHDLFEENREDIETFKKLIRRALPKRLAEVLIRKTERMTHHPLEDYKTYILRVASDKDCNAVKEEDINHNLDGKPSARKKKLYLWALEELKSHR